jgi:hypothetical protein
LDPDLLVRGTDPGIQIRIRTKMSRIPNTVENVHLLCILFSVQLCILLPVKTGQVHDTLGVGEAGEVGLMAKMLAGVVRVLLMTLGETGKN